jgi:hypothetical protein
MKPSTKTAAVALALFAPLSQAAAPPTEACIYIHGYNDGQTSMTFTNKCETCVEYAPMFRNEGTGQFITPISGPALTGGPTLRILRQQPGETAIAGIPFTPGKWTGHATQLKACRN